MSNEYSKLEILLIKTNKGCFISDCKFQYTDYQYDYHKTKLKNLAFDGKSIVDSYLKNWYYIDKYPELIQIKPETKYNLIGYRLIDTEITHSVTGLPVNITIESYNTLTELVSDCYTPKYEEYMTEYITVNPTIKTILEVDNFEYPPDLNIKQVINFKEMNIKVEKTQIKHPLLNKMLTPELLLHNTDCYINSMELYKIVKQYLLENIDRSVADITKEYSHSFTVTKKVKRKIPKSVQYSYMLASTKKERSKIHTKTVEHDTYDILKFTDDIKNNPEATQLEPITGKTEYDLKEKLDTFLRELLEHINKPIVYCECCEGSGLVDKKQIEMRN